MKIKLLSIILAVCVVFAVSCKKENPPQIIQSNTYQDEPEVRVSRNAALPGYAIIVNTGFYVFEGEDTGDEKTVVKWKTSLALGDKVETGETRKMISFHNKKPADFIAVRQETGERGYALENYIAIGGQLAVVKNEEAFLYKTPRSLDVTSTNINYKTIVVYYPETEKSGFVEIKAYDPVRERFVSSSNPYVRVADLSKTNADIQAAIYLHTALAQPADQKIRREKILKDALQDYPDSIFYHEISSVLNSSSGSSSTSSDDNW